MRNRISILIITSVLILTSCNKKTEPGTFIIKGEFENMQPTEILLLDIKNTITGMSKRQEIEVINGKFEYTDNMDSLPYLVATLIKPNPNVKPIFIFLNDQDIITVKGDNRKFSNASINGSESSTLFNEYIKVDKFKIESAVQKMNMDLNKMASTSDTAAIISLRKKIDSLMIEGNKMTKSFISKNSKSPVGMFVLVTDLSGSPDIETLDSLYQMFPKELQKDVYGLMIKTIVDKGRLVKVGANAPDFLALNQKGSAYKLSEIIKEKDFTLIEFWASWCAPCRYEMPAIRKVLDENDKKLTTIFISLDSKGNLWEEAVKSDKIEKHIHTCDLQSWQGPIAQQYNIKSIPANVLINKEGKIVAKNLTHLGLNKFLEKK